MRFHLPFICVVASVAIMGLEPLSGEEKAPLTLSPELLPDWPELPPDKNGLVALLDQLKALDGETKEALQRAREKVRSGEPPENLEIIELLEARHKIAVATLKPPVQCPRQKDFTYLSDPLLSLFQGMEILSWHSFLQGKEKEAMRYLAQGLTWSDLIRKGNPTLIEATFGAVGWKVAFSCALDQWEECEDQKAGLKEIERLFNAHRMSLAEYVPIFQRESQYWIDCGGTKAMLQALDPDTTLQFMLRKPFSDLTAGQVLELPYNQNAEVQNYEKIRLQVLKHLKAGDPLTLWPVPQPPHGDVTLEDYRKRPNGLGDLCHEQSNNLSKNVVASNLFKDPAMATCIAWLKAEGEGREFGPGDPAIKLDPVDGRPLRIDVEGRLIKSVGLNRKPASGDKSAPAILSFDVPEWRDPD